MPKQGYRDELNAKFMIHLVKFVWISCRRTLSVISPYQLQTPRGSPTPPHQDAK